MTKRPLITAVALAMFLLVPASAQAAGNWVSPLDISPLNSLYQRPMIDVLPSGETIVATADDLGGGKGGIRVTGHVPGGALTAQTVPAGGSAQISAHAYNALDIAADGRGVVAWEQSNGLFYALRDPSGAFGAPQQVTGQPTTGLHGLDVAIDGAGTVTFMG